MTVKRRQFTQEFKDSAVRLITEEGYKVSEAARNLDIGVSVLRRWKAEAEAAQQDYGATADLKVELARLKKENHRLKLEREILKKAAAFFAKESGTDIN
jgi:transposase